MSMSNGTVIIMVQTLLQQRCFNLGKQVKLRLRSDDREMENIRKYIRFVYYFYLEVILVGKKGKCWPELSTGNIHKIHSVTGSLLHLMSSQCLFSCTLCCMYNCHFGSANY